MRTEKIMVQGMKDQDDMNKVNEALHDIWGIQKVEISLSKGEAIVSYDENAAALIDFTQAIVDSGYKISNNNDTFNENKMDWR